MTSDTMPKPDLLTRLLVLLLFIVKFFRGGYDVYAARKRIERREQGQTLKLPKAIQFDEQAVAGVPCYRLNNAQQASGKLVLHLHGGAMCLRMPKMETSFVAKFCADIDADGILPWYRLAPEDKFPAGIDDCFAVYRALLEEGHNPQKIVLSGMSAGGGYSLALLSLIKQNNLPMPGCAILMSPSGDSLFVGKSTYENNRRDPLFRTADVICLQNLLVTPEQVANPLLNVSLMDDFSGYPPMYLTASTTEVLRDVSVMAADKARAAGIPVQLDLYQGGMHAIHAMGFARQAKVGWQRIHQFVAKHI